MGCRKLSYYTQDKALGTKSNFLKVLKEKSVCAEKIGIDYFTFGMIMPGRSFSSNEYRYGFQGQEKDDEIKGSGNSVNFKYRMHDPRLGRFFSIDPLTASYPHYTPYSFSGNRVIDAIELEGLEPKWFMDLIHLFGYDNPLEQRKSDDIEEEAQHQHEMQMRRDASKSVAGAIDNLYEAQKNTLGLIPGVDQLFNYFDYKLGKQSGKATVFWSVFAVAPIGKLVGPVLKPVYKYANKTFDSIDDMYKKAINMDLGERIAVYKDAAMEFIENNGLKKNKSLMKKNSKRTIYSDKKGNNYSLDTQHGAFEVTNKRGTHQGEMKFDGKLNTDKKDNTGGHDLIVK